MKKFVLFALVMLVFLAIPVLADAPPGYSDVSVPVADSTCDPVTITPVIL